MCFCFMKVVLNAIELSTNDERAMYQLGSDGDDDNLFLVLCILAWQTANC